MVDRVKKWVDMIMHFRKETFLARRSSMGIDGIYNRTLDWVVFSGPSHMISLRWGCVMALVLGSGLLLHCEGSD